MAEWSPARLDAASLVPLYYQLYEVAKEAIESGTWPPGGRMPSEFSLMQTFDVSRIVVRQALSILEDDGHVTRARGRGTFVAPAKLSQQAGGLSSKLIKPRPAGTTIRVLDNRTQLVPHSIRRALMVGDDDDVVRITSLLSIDSQPVAITYSFFPQRDIAELADQAKVGHLLPRGLTLENLGIELRDCTASIEVSDACKFEADRLGVPLASTVFVVMCIEHRELSGRTIPLEVARVMYRGTALRLLFPSPPRDPALEPLGQS